ncbi:maleylpyruvate isomerase family mycothiol-dependent enzyme [Catenuloplanes atrovinosus]|uniref:Uncharacterized protein (TIGR03083 family) n=1 Tax=Catenuloplanes atrovinosus TaxID=137266 RepID=A0AAE3YQI2_9ACTN|nr:maleylpyruvate isomerase family mycothiol-dependent enzyme [Catenuloplanes atrovinosus]MDR7275946.1 uncharacterized protein (TIGR03083 family) [Catenuloplanes atrovinosus]
MDETVEFPELLRLIDERAAAFRAAIAAADDLAVPVPTCPEWTLFDLARHVGEGRRKWARIVTAGPADAPPPASSWQDRPVPGERDALVAWLADSTRELLDTLRQAGPEHGCWTWWGPSQSPQTCGAVARHQLQEVAVHTYDAQLTAGAPRPLPPDVAVDGVEEFLVTCCATTKPWPHEPAVVDYHITEGRSWRILLSADGARVSRRTTPTAATQPSAAPADASATATASDLVLHFYGRLPLDSLTVDGDRRVFDHLIAWDPDA